jgi:cytochrome c-type biogenesis protein CcmE
MRKKGRCLVLSRKNKIIFGGLIVLLLAGYLIWSSFSTASQKNVSVKEIVTNKEKYLGSQIRLTGKVAPGTIKKEGQTIEFEITENGANFKVVYKGGVPNSFQDNADVIADGEISEDGSYFEAKSLIVKCPSKYTAGKGSK